MTKIRDWFINRLGGYTREEYREILTQLNGLRNADMKFTVQTLKPETLRVNYEFPLPEKGLAEAFKRAEARVKVGLQDSALEYMDIRTRRDFETRTVTLTGTLLVLPKEAARHE